MPPQRDPAYYRKWRKENPEKARAIQQRYLARNPDYVKRWHAANQDRVRASRKRYETESPGKVRASKKKWRDANRARFNATRRRWRLANLEKVRAQGRAYRAANRERVRAYGYKKLGLPAPTRPRPLICEACGASPQTRGLHLDHCHETNKFRGWLCAGCNLMLGKMGDNAAGVRRHAKQLLKYLEAAARG